MALKKCFLAVLLILSSIVIATAENAFINPSFEDSGGWISLNSGYSIINPYATYGIYPYNGDKVLIINSQAYNSMAPGFIQNIPTRGSITFYYNVPNTFSGSSFFLVKDQYNSTNEYIRIYFGQATNGWVRVETPSLPAGLYDIYTTRAASGTIMFDDFYAEYLHTGVNYENKTYNSGDTAIIEYSVENPNAQSQYQLEIADAHSVRHTENIIHYRKRAGCIEYTFPENTRTGTWLVFLNEIDSTGTVTRLAGNTTRVNGVTSTISFDKSSYRKGDAAAITYTNMEVGTHIYIVGLTDNGTEVYSNYYIRGGDGVLNIAIPNTQQATHYKAVARYDGYTLATANANIIDDVDITISGTVYNASTNTAMHDAYVFLDGYGRYTNAGRYSFTTTPGLHTIRAGAPGHANQQISIVLTNDHSHDFYLSAANFAGAIHGFVRDDRGLLVDDVNVSIKNATVTKFTNTHSGGWYYIDGLADGQTYTISASKSGYVTYTTQVLLQQVLAHDILLSNTSNPGIPGPGNPGDPNDPNAERPGRIAAKRSLIELEGIVPSLIMFAVLIVFMNLMKKI